MRQVVAASLLVAFAGTAACVARHKDLAKDNVVEPGGAVAVNGGSGATEGGVTDSGSGASEAGVTSCLPGTYTVDQDVAYGGTLAITGTIELAAVVAVNHLVYLNIVPANASTGSQINVVLTQPSSTFTYRIRGLAAGSYLVSAQADVAGSSAVGEQGDLDGYYQGTAAAPALTRAEATPITLTDQCRSGLDFGIGIRR